MPLEFVQHYCKMAVMIVGEKVVLSKGSINPYVNFIRKEIEPARIETVYLIGHPDNKTGMVEISRAAEDTFETVGQRKVAKLLRFNDGSVQKTAGFIVVLRNRTRPVYIPSVRAVGRA